MRLAERWFALLLRLFPAPFRERHGDGMRETFARAWTERRGRGRLALAAFLVRTTVNLTASGVRERLSWRPRAAAGGSMEPARLFSWLDVKLGVRMLVKHPGLTLVSTFALAVGIPVGLAPGHFVDGLTAPLPVPEGAQIRWLKVWSRGLGQVMPTTTREFEAWEGSLTSFQELGAFREIRYNLGAGEGVEVVRGALVTASSFTILGVGPLLGRTLQSGDEAPGAEHVAVLGYDVWQSRFGGDRDIVGRVVRLGGEPHTVVGVMPEGFLFPKHESLWTPMPAVVGGGPESAVPVRIFGRLRDGVTKAQADGEFALVASRSVPPGTDLRLTYQVAPFALMLAGGLNGSLRATPEFLGFQGLAWLVLLVACANVGMLVFARTSARADELAVRTALGASRARIVAQVFVECLVLAVVAAGAGLVLMQGIVEAMWRLMPAAWAAAAPYWIDLDVRPVTALHAVALAGVSAAVAGVVPALRFTGRSVQSNIRRARARRTGARFGGLSGILIVADVAVSVIAVALSMAAVDQLHRAGTAEDSVGIPAGEYLAATVRLSPGSGEASGAGSAMDRRERMAAAQDELVRRLREAPEVRGVAVADALPRMDHHTSRVEAEDVASPDDRRGVSSRVARVAVDYFRALDRPVLAGRDFEVADVEAGHDVVIVNATFVEHVLGGENPIGRRIRFVPWGDGEPGPWQEIVGVVGHLGMRIASPRNDQGVYVPVAAGDLATIDLGIHVGGDPASFSPRLRELAGQVDPAMIVSVVGPLDGVYEGDWYIILAAGLGAGLLVGVLLALVASGIYAIMSSAVAQRTTEIGIRVALGAGRPEIVGAVVRRAVGQLMLGVLLGCLPLTVEFFSTGDAARYAWAARVLVACIGLLVIVGLAACTGPTLRALRVDPNEALRAEG